MTTDGMLHADTERIEQLVGRVIRGGVRIPDFQRPMRWQHSDVRKLFDSIYRGFPIGTLLLWQRAADANSTLRIGSVVIEAPASDRALWVIDGQQRLTSLVGVLGGPGAGMFDVWFDLETEEFFHPRRHRSRDLAVPMHVVLDAAGLQDWLFDFHSRTGRRDLVGVANRLGASIRDYRVPLYIVDVEDEAVARDIFIRTNRSGRAMEMHEVFAAMAAPGTDRSVRPAQIAQRLASRFGEVNPNNVFKAAQALRGDTVTHEPQLVHDDGRVEWMAETERALEIAYEFLAQEVFHTRLLPARVTPVVALARFFHRFPDPTERNLRLLRRWAWRGFFSGTLESDARTLRRAVVSISEDEDDSVQSLLRSVSTERRPLPHRVDSRDSSTRLAFLVLAHQEPRFPGPNGVLCSEVFSWLRDHDRNVFVQWPGAPNVPWARFLTPGRSRAALAEQIRAWCSEPEDWSAELGSQLVSREAADALRTDDVSSFLELRHQALDQAAARLHSARAEPAASDRRALRAG